MAGTGRKYALAIFDTGNSPPCLTLHDRVSGSGRAAEKGFGLRSTPLLNAQAYFAQLPSNKP